MDFCETRDELYFKELEEYKEEINKAIEQINKDNNRLVFANVVKTAGINEFIVRRYPDLRLFILDRIKYYKEIKIIDDKIDRAINTLIKSDKNITVIALMNKCKFQPELIHNNIYLKEKIRKAVIDNSHRFLKE